MFTRQVPTTLAASMVSNLSLPACRKDIAELKGYSLILDRASDAGIIFASPKADISNDVLTKLGYN